MRNRTINILLAMLLSVVVVAQEAATINWLSTSQFEK